MVLSRIRRRASPRRRHRHRARLPRRGLRRQDGRIRRAAGRRDHHAGRRPGPPGRGRPGVGRRHAPARRRPPRLRAASERRRRGRQGGSRVPLGRRGRRLARRRDHGCRRGRRGRDADRLRPAARRRPALVAGPAERGAGARDDPDAAHRARPGRPGDLPAERGPGDRLAGTPRPADRGVRPPGPARQAQGRHDPRRARLLRAPLRERGRGCGDPVPLHAGPGVGRRCGAAGRADPPRGGGGRVPRELGEPGHREGDRARGGRPDRRRAVRGETYAGALAADADALVRGMSSGRVDCRH